MTFSPKSLQFASKILHFNPLPTCHSHEQQKEQLYDQSCLHPASQSKESLRPYLHVHDHRKQRQIYEKPIKQKLQNMQTFKEQGNQHFKLKKYIEAAYFYKKVIIYSDYTFPDNQSDQKLINQLVQQANCNLGMARMKLGQIRKALEHFGQGLKGPLQKTQIKSLYWMFKCYICLGEYEKANQGLQKLKRFGLETVKQVSELEAELRRSQQADRKNKKSIYEKMLVQ